MNGILYFTIPDHVFAINARTGEQLWQYDFEDQGGHLVGQRGVGMYGNWLYFLTPDGWFISLNAKDGKERWQQESRRREAAILHHHGAADREESRDRRRGRRCHGRARLSGIARSGNRRTAVALVERAAKSRAIRAPRPGRIKAAMDHGGGMTWLPGTYDPELNLLYWGTGNANPVFAGQSRKGANL